MTNAKHRLTLYGVLGLGAVGIAVLVAIGVQSSSIEARDDPETAIGAGVSSPADVRAAAVQRPTGGESGLAPSIAAAQQAPEPAEPPIYSNDFSNANDIDRIDHFVHYRDPFVVTHTSGSSDHGPTGGPNCTAPEETRSQSKDRPEEHVYQCFPGGDAAKGHVMAYAMDASGYGFVGGLPDQVFEDVNEVSVDINTTSAGSRNFVEIKVIPAWDTFVNAMPCGPDLPCNEGWDYDDIGAVGAVTVSNDGTGLQIATAEVPDGHLFDQFATFNDAFGSHYESCHNSSSCFEASVHEGNDGIRDRYRHVFRDNENGTISFGIAEQDGRMHWVTAPGEFPSGPVRVVVAFHNYTGTKDGNGPGFDQNLSPSTGGFTWHWDNINVYAEEATPATEFFGGVSADRIVTRPGCVSFSQGQRGLPHDSDIAPELRCT